MKTMSTVFLVCIFLNSQIISLEKNKTSIIKQNDNTYLLKFANLQLVVNPLIGGRITSIKLDAKEFLVGKEVHQLNYGSTFWPAPQSIWNWPPPFTLDQAPYEVISSSKTILLKSKVDTVLALQFTKEFSISEADTSIQIKYTIINPSGKDTKISPWEITRMPKGGIAFFPKGLTEPKVKNFDPIPYEEINNLLWYKSENKKESNHKLSVADGSDGWFAYTVDEFIFIKKWGDVLPENQAQGEGEIPLYVSPDYPYLEIEAQGPFQIVKAGKEINWNMKWFIRKLPSQIKREIGNNELVKFVKRIVR